MWENPDSADQAKAYGDQLLHDARLTDAERFLMLRALSVTIVGVRVSSESRMSKEEVESKMLAMYQERIVIDLHEQKEGLGRKFDIEMMLLRNYGVPKSGAPKKRVANALEKAAKKAIAKNILPPSQQCFTGLECSDLFNAIKSEALNTFNPARTKALNKNGELPSGLLYSAMYPQCTVCTTLSQLMRFTCFPKGLQLADVLDKVREAAFELKERKRIGYLIASRAKTAAAKKASLTEPTNDKGEEVDENEEEEKENAEVNK